MDAARSRKHSIHLDTSNTNYSPLFHSSLPKSNFRSEKQCAINATIDYVDVASEFSKQFAYSFKISLKSSTVLRRCITLIDIIFHNISHIHHSNSYDRIHRYANAIAYWFPNDRRKRGNVGMYTVSMAMSRYADTEQ